MTDLPQQIFFEVFESLPRQGPGSFAATQRAFAACADLPTAPRIVDLGCGAGAQTVALAQLTGGTIVAVDSHAPLIERLRERLDELGATDRVETRVGDMAAIDLPRHSFDLVWSEGALYNLGLAVALPRCAELLRPGGYLVFTDAVWRSDDPPDDVQALFADYPTMGGVGDVVAQLENHGWEVIDWFDLPDEAWWEDFYAPMERRIESLREKYAGDAEALAALDELAREPEMHRRSGQQYGYAFFVARRPPQDAAL